MKIDLFMVDGTVYSQCVAQDCVEMENLGFFQCIHPRVGLMWLNKHYIVRIKPSSALESVSTNGPDETGVLGKIGVP